MLREKRSCCMIKERDYSKAVNGNACRLRGMYVSTLSSECEYIS